MGLALVIVGGLVLMTVSAAGFDYLGKRRKASGGEVQKKVNELEERLSVLEGKIADRDEKIAQLESDLSFVNKLIEDKRP